MIDTTNTDLNATFNVFEPRLPKLLEQIEVLNRRATKLGVQPVIVTKTGKITDEPIMGKNPVTGHMDVVVGYNRFVEIIVTGSTPKLAGWTLAAVVEHAEEGNILRKVPGCKVELNQFRTGAPCCNHCNTVRNRKDTFIVIHDNGAMKMVGSNCIKDFLGGVDPRQLASYAEILFSIGESCGEAEESEDCGGGGQPTIYSVARMLAYSTCAIRKLGFVSGKVARESQEAGGDKTSTSMTARFWMFPTNRMKLDVDYFVPTDEDKAFADRARQFVLDTIGAKDPETLSDFEHNMLTVCKCEGVELRNLGLLAFVPEYMARENEKTLVRQQENAAGHYGVPGTRYKKQAITYLRSTGFDSQFGYTYIHTFAADTGARLVWKTGTELPYTTGDKLVATFTVKEHSEWKGNLQTKVSRVVFH